LFHSNGHFSAYSDLESCITNSVQKMQLVLHYI
jgi:hypothetical protein